VSSRRDILFASASGLIALAAIYAMPQLVATPKLLFGRSLSAITPSLFPYVTLTLIVLLSVAVIAMAWFGMNSKHDQSTNGSNSEAVVDSDQAEGTSQTQWLAIGAFFILLAGYGFVLKPFGFLISSFIVLCATSLLLGNRSWLQISLLAIFGPVCLYLLATRVMLVSLPELDQIELLYAQLIGFVQNRVLP